jgi:membrane-associated phospholipid phosphatase
MGKSAKKAAKRLAKAEHEATAAIAKARAAKPVALLGAVGELADQPPLFLLSAGTLALGLATLVKRSVDRARPAHALRGADPEPGAGRGAKDTAYNSLPSGHTAGAVAVGQAVAHENPAAAVPAKLAAAAVGAIQLPHGKHYLSDVAIGAAIGWLAERVAGMAVDAAERAWARHAPVDPIAEAEAHPS